MNAAHSMPISLINKGKDTQTSNEKKTPVPHQAVIDEMTPKLVAPQQWQKPSPLKSDLLSVSSVSRSMLPEPLRPWLLDISDRMKCPIDYIASATVVMISSLIGTRLAIKPKAKDDWTIIVNLWGAVIGDPSTMKTPSVSEVLKTLNRLIAESRSQYEEELQRYEAEQVTYEAQKKVYQSQEQDRLKGKPVSNAVSYPEAPDKPTERRFMANDTTIEKLAELLNQNLTGMLIYRDELIGLIAAWDKVGHEQDRAFYLEGWNGSGSMTIDRMSRGTTYVKNICVSLFGGIQPSKLMGYLRAATQYDNDGFVQRLQVSVYPDKPTWEYKDEFPDAYARDKAFTIIQQIADSDFSAIGYPSDQYNRHAYTRFDAEAQEIFKQWLTDWETNVLPGENGLLLEHFTKYRSLMPSLALVFHVVNTIDSPLPANPDQKYLVSAQATLMAVEWCTYLQSHARRIYGLLNNQSIESAKALLQHLKAGHLKDGFKARDVQRKGWTSLNDLDSVESAIAELCGKYWLKEVQPDTPSGGRPESAHYLINPEIIQIA